MSSLSVVEMWFMLPQDGCFRLKVKVIDFLLIYTSKFCVMFFFLLPYVNDV